MNRLLQVLSLSALGIALCLSFNSIASNDKAIAAEKGSKGSSQSDVTVLESQQFSKDTKIDAEVVYGGRTPDWAFQSLKDLAERHDCMTGLNLPWQPKPTDDRYTLAFTLNSCLDQIISRHGDLTKKDKEITDKLMAEFKPEWQAMKARYSRLEDYAAGSSQRSPTSKVIVDRILPDVSPSQWNAVKSLTLKYNCISGLPNGLFQPDRPTTRYELAAGLNACLTRINNRFATEQDRTIAQTLQKDFKTELAELKNRAKSLENKAATLEFQKFSPTSKLQGQTVITVQGGGFR